MNGIIPCPRCVELQHYILQNNCFIYWQSVALYHERLASARIGGIIEAQQHQINQLEISLAKTILETQKVIMSLHSQRRK